MKRTEIRLKIDADDLAILDDEAAKTGLSRSDLLRYRAVAPRRYSPTDYSRLVSEANRVADIPRGQVERLVNYVFVELMGPGAGEANP
jgi:hypothetical protein